MLRCYESPENTKVVLYKESIMGLLLLPRTRGREIEPSPVPYTNGKARECNNISPLRSRIPTQTSVGSSSLAGNIANGSGTRAGGPRLPNAV